MSAPKRLAADMGVIRGYSKNGGMCYVEPKSIVGKGDELSEIREEIAAVETQIMQHQIASIARVSPFIERALDAMARIDVIFARAAFGLTLNGIIPAVGCNGIVDIQSFVHPVLALSEKSPVVPIDLILDSDSRSLNIWSKWWWKNSHAKEFWRCIHFDQGCCAHSNKSFIKDNM